MSPKNLVVPWRPVDEKQLEKDARRTLKKRLGRFMATESLKTSQKHPKASYFQAREPKSGRFQLRNGIKDPSGLDVDVE